MYVSLSLYTYIYIYKSLGCGNFIVGRHGDLQQEAPEDHDPAHQPDLQVPASM